MYVKVVAPRRKPGVVGFANLQAEAGEAGWQDGPRQRSPKSGHDSSDAGENRAHIKSKLERM